MLKLRVVGSRLTIGVLALLMIVAPTSTFGKKAKAHGQEVESSVVKIIVHSNPPDLLSPWQKSGIEASSGSGVIIDGHRILTSAHVVEDAVSIEVKRAGRSERYSATAEFVGHDCDLALLTVEDERFFADSQSLRGR